MCSCRCPAFWLQLWQVYPQRIECRNNNLESGTLQYITPYPGSCSRWFLSLIMWPWILTGIPHCTLTWSIDHFVAAISVESYYKYVVLHFIPSQPLPHTCMIWRLGLLSVRCSVDQACRASHTQLELKLKLANLVGQGKRIWTEWIRMKWL